MFNPEVIARRRKLAAGIARDPGWRLLTNAPVLVRAGLDVGHGIVAVVSGTRDGWWWHIERGFTQLVPGRCAPSLVTALVLARFRAVYEHEEFVKAHNRRLMRAKNQRRKARQQQQEVQGGDGGAVGEAAAVAGDPGRDGCAAPVRADADGVPVVRVSGAGARAAVDPGPVVARVGGADAGADPGASVGAVDRRGPCGDGPV